MNSLTSDTVNSPGTNITLSLAIEVLDTLPNPVLVKNESLEYVWINAAFEQLFSVRREDVIGKNDKALFPDRQVSQCNGGDLRVLESGEVDESVETVFEQSGGEREMITRKSRLTDVKGEVYLLGVMHDITDVTRTNEALKISEAKLQEQAHELSVLATTDILTGCGNRRALIERSSELLNNKFSSVALILIDLDKFKSINDTYGHDAGDETLKHFAQEINSQISESDTLYRIGGEEFVLLLDCESAEKVGAIADSLRHHIETSSLDTEHGPISYTVSMGIAMKAKGDSVKLEHLLSRADKCLYVAKRQGRNRVELAA